MLKIDFLEPRYKKIEDNTLCIGFGSQNLILAKDGELYSFIPIEAKEVRVDLRSSEVLNLGDVLVFQRKNRFLRIPIMQLLMGSDISKYLIPIFENLSDTDCFAVTPVKSRNAIKESTEELVAEIEIAHLYLGINKALDEKDKDTFMALSARLNELLGVNEVQHAN